MSKIGGDVTPQKFSQKNVALLCAELRAMEESQRFSHNNFGEVLRTLAESMIWSDKNGTSCFDIFLEQDIMSTLESIVTNVASPSTVKAQVLQFITLLLHNITWQPYIYYICSKNRLNRMISIDFSENDDELLSVYVSFLKSLALRCDENTVQFFFIQQLGVFPLLEYGIKLINTPDRMARAAARQVVISVAQIPGPGLSAFMENAMQDVFRSITAELWHQINVVSSVVNRFLTAVAGSGITPPLPTVGSLRDNMEDVVDDLFYINDLFAVPHAFAQKGLEVALVEKVIDPLMTSIEASVSTSPSDSSPAVAAVHPSVALHVLARWLLLNKEERIRKVVCDRLLGGGDSQHAECLLRRVLREGCMQCLSAALLLVGIMVKIGVFGEGEEAREAVDNPTYGEGGTSEASTEVMNVDDMMGILNERFESDNGGFLHNRYTDQPSEVVPPCETFLSEIQQKMGCTTRGLWCVWVLGALYRLIRCSLLTRLSIFEAALAFLGDLAPDPRTNNVVFAGLLFLAERMVKMRLLVYYDVLKQRRSESSMREVSTDKECLRLACEALFLEMEGAYSAKGSCVECSLESITQDASLLLPLLPHLDSTPTEKPCCGGGPVCDAERYTDIQKTVGAMVQCCNRAAHDKEEQRDKEFSLLARIHYVAHGKLPDGCKFLSQLGYYSLQHSVASCVCLPLANLIQVRCDLVKEVVPGRGTSRAIVAGTPMCMVLLKTEIIFVTCRESDSCFRRDVIHGPVVFAMQNIYVNAALSRLPFGVVFTHFLPANSVRLHVAFRSSSVAQRIVNLVNKQCTYWRCHGAALVYNNFGPGATKANASP
uniref:FPL domain-containing protein n=1 Tax=Trypanosoma congolense (strain IL3000) TaxID=1068625 RepID=G0UUB4_TRYCI|nr:conserved hypothetical protein [Trypanosoma congolense IL3000]